MFLLPMTDRNQQNYLTDKDSGTLSGMSGKDCPMLTPPLKTHWSSHRYELYKSHRKHGSAVKLLSETDVRRVPLHFYS